MKKYQFLMVLLTVALLMSAIFVVADAYCDAMHIWDDKMDEDSLKYVSGASGSLQFKADGNICNGLYAQTWGYMENDEGGSAQDYCSSCGTLQEAYIIGCYNFRSFPGISTDCQDTEGYYSYNCPSGQVCANGRCTAPLAPANFCTADCNCASGCCDSVSVSCSGGCFLKGTGISMQDGTTKPIEDVKVGDLVAAYDPENNVKSYGRVAALLRHTPEELRFDYYLIINDKIKVTPEHRIFTDKGLIEAKDLVVGSKIITLNLVFFC